MEGSKNGKDVLVSSGQWLSSVLVYTENIEEVTKDYITVHWQRYGIVTLVGGDVVYNVNAERE